MNKTQLAYELYKIQAIKLGSFVLKSGANSSIYIDLREIIAYPQLLRAVAEQIWTKIAHLDVNLICGVPYTALPIATCISLDHNLPMVIRRKEAKNYGTKKLIEGVFKPNQACFIIEDIVTSGTSILETSKDLTEAGLQVPYSVAFLDREQGGPERLTQAGQQFFSVFTLSELLIELKNSGQLNPQELQALANAMPS